MKDQWTCLGALHMLVLQMEEVRTLGPESEVASSHYHHCMVSEWVQAVGSRSLAVEVEIVVEDSRHIRLEVYRTVN